MALVTCIPRIIPAILVDKIKPSAKIEKFLKLIPYTAMTALIFPGILTIDANSLVPGVMGLLAAGLLALKKQPVMIVVIVAVIVEYIVYMFI